jgi:hypothetical protein
VKQFLFGFILSSILTGCIGAPFTSEAPGSLDAATPTAATPGDDETAAIADQPNGEAAAAQQNDLDASDAGPSDALAVNPSDSGPAPHIPPLPGTDAGMPTQCVPIWQQICCPDDGSQCDCFTGYANCPDGSYRLTTQ